MEVVAKTKFNFKKQVGDPYIGKVRDVYNIDDKYLAMVVTDRISAFDVVLPQFIPLKGQVLNQIASNFLDMTDDICPNWKIATIDPMVTFGYKAEPFKVEMVIRGYLTGHAWREYKLGKRTLCGMNMPDGMVENQKFNVPIITPTTKELEGHDEDISREEIISSGLVSESNYQVLEKYTYKLFARGTEIAERMGLILVDTKYEFGIRDAGTDDAKIILIDEIHTPDSSRYFIKNGYETRQAKDQKQKQLSKEFVRDWLKEQGFSGDEGQSAPIMTEEYVAEVSQRYVELYEKIMGNKLVPHTEIARDGSISDRIEKSISDFVNELV